MKDIFDALNIAGIRAMPGKGELKYEAVSKSMNRRAIDHNSRSLTGIATPSRVYLIDTGNEGRARDSCTP
jgi:hypothetical protein